MTVILVLLTFGIFLLLDFWMEKRPAAAKAPVPLPKPAPVAFVEGFAVPTHLRFHPGHAWLARERKNFVRVGADEFAAALAGKIDKIDLPRIGQWIRQGQRAWTFFRAGEKADMVSPVEGEVLEVNAEVVADPSLVRRDPFGRGWLFTVHVPDEESTGRNLVPVHLVKAWMKDAVERLLALEPATAGVTAFDAGRPAEDLLAGLPAISWSRTAARFFLTEAE
jgi:glycine cleavage system H protein